MGPNLPVAIHHLVKKTIVPVIFEQPFGRLRFALAGHFATLILRSTTAWIFLRFKNSVQIEGVLRHRGHDRCCLFLTLHNSTAVLAIALPPREKSLAETVSVTGFRKSFPQKLFNYWQAMDSAIPVGMEGYGTQIR
jgi:hypothetical protein